MQGVNESETMWDITHRGKLASNVNLVLESDDCRVMKVEGDDGEGVITMYQVMDGIYILYNDFHMSRCNSEHFFDGTMLCIDYCREGRMEIKTEKGSVYYMEKGDMVVGEMMHRSGICRFPLSHFHGITIGFECGVAEEALRREMPGFSFDLAELIQKFSCGTPFVIHDEPSVEHLFYQLSHLPQKVQKEYFKVKVTELLIYLSGMEIGKYKVEKPYFYTGQVEKIRAVHDLITKDLTVSYTIEELSEKFSISLTALKKCFKGTYGKPIYTYLKEFKMKKAMELLMTRPELKVSEVGQCVGYDSASKFTAVFHKMVGETPLEYKKNHGTER